MHYLTKFPEYYLIVLALLVGYTPPFSFNPVAVVLVIILALQIAYKNKVAGLILSALFVVTNFYMVAALISEFNEFQIINFEAKELMTVGLLIFIVNLFIASLMILKYAQGSRNIPSVGGSVGENGLKTED